jgi:hypothetical protein
VSYLEAEPGRLQRWLERFGVGLAPGSLAALPEGWQGSLTVLGLLPPAAAAMADDLAWLGALGKQGAKAPPRPDAFSGVTHCLCTAP